MEPMVPTRQSDVSFYFSSRFWGYSLESDNSLSLKELTLVRNTISK